MNLSALFIQCRSGFVTPTETFQGLDRLNVSDGLQTPSRSVLSFPRSGVGMQE